MGWDITYIPTDEGWLYTAIVKDLCSKKVIGYAFSDHIDSNLTSAALEMAVMCEQPPDGLIWSITAQETRRKPRYLLIRSCDWDLFFFPVFNYAHVPEPQTCLHSGLHATISSLCKPLSTSVHIGIECRICRICGNPQNQRYPSLNRCLCYLPVFF